MPGYIGTIATFDSGIEDWATYIERVELVCDVNNVADGKKVSVVLNVLVAKTYSLLRSLFTPEKPADKSFKDIVDTLQNHLSPKPFVKQ